mmetsp:Transcript_27686/g.51953  ORF Transcript_27686/g.51953 Transcript_27686/m.51953 type:complete len:501 (+) Transcript_27686:154-1656(+)
MQRLFYCLFLFSVVVVTSSYLVLRVSGRGSSLASVQMSGTTKEIKTETIANDGRGQSIQVAHIGNSIQYFNDCPRLLEHMLRNRFETVKQDSCLRGGATLSSLFEKGNGMLKKFGGNDIGTPTVADLLQERQWDFVVINDHTQSPVRPERKQQSMDVLRNSYIPLLRNTTTVIFIQTAAYKSPVKESEDLGGFDKFTEGLWQGYQEYAALVQAASHNSIQAKIAPVGLAYQYVKKYHGEDLWAKLYFSDDFHPSPHGTWLEACVLYCTMVGQPPPTYNPDWWKTARYMQPPEEDQLPLPTDEDAALLSNVAWKLCQEQEKHKRSLVADQEIKLQKQAVVRVGVGVLVTDPSSPNKVFCGIRKGSHGAGKLALPGGHLEMFESWEDCACREVLEECNLELQTPLFGHVTNDPMPDEKKHYVTIFMMGECKVTNPPQKPRNMEPEKCEGWKSYTWDELKSLRQQGKLFGPLDRLVQESPKAITEFLNKSDNKSRRSIVAGRM